MPRRRLSMRKIRETLRLLWNCRQKTRAVAASIGVSPSTVLDYKYRAQAAKLSWPLPEDLDDTALEHKLYPPQTRTADEIRPMPDWFSVHKELKGHKGVTLQLLWNEYKQLNPDGYQYSRFCELYRSWSGSLDIAMRQDYVAGEKMFVDYAGTTVPVWDPVVKQVRQAQIFVAVLGASNYVYADATWTQSLPDWIGSHVRAFEFFGGVTEICIPDNLKSGVKSPCFYDPDINPTYLALAQHYETVVIPARVKKPKDKAKAEQGVQLVTRWILAPLRHRTFTSITALRQAVARLVTIINVRPFKKLPGNREEMFETLDKPALKPLPVERFEFFEVKKARVHIDYHVDVKGHFYSVPCELRKKEVEARYTQNTVEVFYQGKRVASHKRNSMKGKFTTLSEHMPPSHRAYKEWSPERFRNWAAKKGENVRIMIDRVFEERPHPALGFRTCLGILRLADKYGDERLDAACDRALRYNSISSRSVRMILKSGLDKRKESQQTSSTETIEHRNIRGAGYYAASETPMDLGNELPEQEMEVN